MSCVSIAVCRQNGSSPGSAGIFRGSAIAAPSMVAPGAFPVENLVDLGTVIVVDLGDLGTVIEDGDVAAWAAWAWSRSLRLAGLEPGIAHVLQQLGW